MANTKAMRIDLKIYLVEYKWLSSVGDGPRNIRIKAYESKGTLFCTFSSWSQWPMLLSSQISRAYSRVERINEVYRHLKVDGSWIPEQLRFIIPKTNNVLFLVAIMCESNNSFVSNEMPRSFITYARTKLD